MDAAQWKKVEDLYYRALELEGPARRRFLDRRCGGDETLLREVETLLAAGADSRSIDGLLGGAAGALLGVQPEARSSAESGSEDVNRRTAPESVRFPVRLGPYRIVREIGRGGLGTVFLAERDDEHYSAQVAIKLVRRGLDTDDILERLRQERQILARLEHANITRLIDGGSTPEGQPYLVMEYVDGEALDVYCDARRLSVRERVRLILDVCSAVSAAHRSLIIHRDLKPSNVLVDGDGQVKLLDFGLAQLLDRDAERERTLPGQRYLTPGYASPEQLRGEPLTTATDIYSLGASLYRLLTGATPFSESGAHEESASGHSGLRSPRRPSSLDFSEEMAARRGLAARRLSRQLRGDLDNILLRAMAPRPDERYGAVAELAEDLERHLDDRPIRARPPKLGTRLIKLVRRHRLASATIAVAVLSLLGGVVATEWQAEKARRAQAEAKQVSSFLSELLEASKPEVARGDVVTVRSILDRGARRILDELSEEPVVQARLMATMGRSYLSLGLYQQAADLYGRALETNGRVFGEQSRQWAASANDLAGVLISLGEFAQAKELLEKAEAIQRGDRRVAPLSLGDTLVNLAIVRRRERQPEDAERLLLEALGIFGRALGEENERSAQALNNLGVVHRSRGRFQEAERLFRQASNLRVELLGFDHPDALNSVENLARTLRLQGELEEAAGLIESVVETRRRVLGDRHRGVAEGLNNLAQVYEKSGRLDDAIEHFREAREIFAHTLGPGSQMAAQTATNLGQALLAAGDRGGAEEAFRQSLEAQLELPISAELGRVHESLGALLCESSDPVAGELLLRRAAEIRQEVHGSTRSDRWRIANAQSRLAECLLEGDRAREAADLLVAAREEMARRFGVESSRVQAVDLLLERASSAGGLDKRHGH